MMGNLMGCAAKPGEAAAVGGVVDKGD